MESTKVRILMHYRHAVGTAESAWFFEDSTDINADTYADFAYFLAKSLVRYESVDMILSPTTYKVTKPLSVEQVKKVINLLKKLAEC